MKGRNLLIIALLVLALGIALIFLNNTISSTGVVITGGILFILAGIFNMGAYMGQRRGGTPQRNALRSAISWVASVAAVILGLAMLLFQTTFTPLVPFMFGVLVAFAALYQYFMLAYGSRPSPLPGWLYIFATLMAAAAVYLFLGKDETLTDRVIMLITGISLAVFGLMTVYEAIVIGRHNREIRKAETVRSEGKAAKADTSAPDASPKPLDEKTEETPVTNESEK